MSIATEITRLQTAKADIKNAIEQKGVTVGDGTIDTYAEKISEISSGGGQSIDLFPYMNSVTFSSAFSEMTEPMTFHLEQATSLAQTFYNVLLMCPKITLYVSNKCTSMNQTFRYGSWDKASTIEEIKIVGDTSKVTTYNQMFINRELLKRVLGAFDFSSCTNASNMFNGCGGLEEFYPVANTIKISIGFSSSPNLIPESRQAIFDGLATVETAQTLTLHANLKILQSQVDSANAKGWTIAGGTVVSEEEYYG